MVLWHSTDDIVTLKHIRRRIKSLRTKLEHLKVFHRQVLLLSDFKTHGLPSQIMQTELNYNSTTAQEFSSESCRARGLERERGSVCNKKEIVHFRPTFQHNIVD